MKITDWRNITISAKEFVTGIAFVFTLSGVYYKLYYEQANYKTTTDSTIEGLKKRVEALEASDQITKDGIRELHEDKIKRDALDQARLQQNGYMPMTRIK